MYQLVAILNLILNGMATVLQISKNLLLMLSQLDLNGEETGKVLLISHIFNLTTKAMVQIPLERKHLPHLQNPQIQALNQLVRLKLLVYQMLQLSWTNLTESTLRT